MLQDNLPPRPPNADESWHTIEDTRWQLENATSDRWTVEEAAYVENPNHGGELPVNVTLSHEIGATIECRAFDPWRSRSVGPSVIRAHRIIVDSPTLEDRQFAVMLDDSGVQYVEDQGWSTSKLNPGSPTVSSTTDALRCIAAAALLVSRRVQDLDERLGEVADYSTEQASLAAY